jgi:Predicted hydrolase (metallo-beta-lactamase superfamily)
LKRIIDETDVKKMIMDHHLLRDINYKEKIADLYEYSEEKGVQILSAAEYIGRENDLLEARRRELWHSQEIKNC